MSSGGYDIARSHNVVYELGHCGAIWEILLTPIATRPFCVDLNPKDGLVPRDPNTQLLPRIELSELHQLSAGPMPRMPCSYRKKTLAQNPTRIDATRIAPCD